MTREDPTASPHPRISLVWEDGTLCGIVGATLLATWFLGVDLFNGHPLLTPSVLAETLFDGGVGATVTITMKNVLAYTGVHVMVFLIMGWAMAVMFREFRVAPNFGTGYLLLFILFEIIIFGVQIALTGNIRVHLGAYQTAIGNALSAAGMFWFLMRRNPDSMKHLIAAWHEAPPAR